MASGFIAIGSGPAGLAAAEVFRRRHRYSRTDHHDRPRPALRQAAAEQVVPVRSAGHARLHTPTGSADTTSNCSRHHRRAHRPGQPRSRHRRRPPLPYWHLVLACGSTAVPLKVPGGEAALSLRSLADAVILRMVAVHAESAVVVGGGLIGCEAASSLATRGMLTTLVAPDLCLCCVDLDPRSASACKMLSDIGVRFIESATVTAVEDTRCSWTPVRRSRATRHLCRRGVPPTSGSQRRPAPRRRKRPHRRRRAHAHLCAQRLCGRGRRARLQHHRGPTHTGRALARRSSAGSDRGSIRSGLPGSLGRGTRTPCTIGESVLKNRGWGAGYRARRPR